MGRIWLLAIVTYCYGGAGFDGHRPAALDQPLRTFHRTVDKAASDAQRLLVSIDNSANVIGTLPMLGDRLRRLGEALAPA